RTPCRAPPQESSGPVLRRRSRLCRLLAARFSRSEPSSFDPSLASGCDLYPWLSQTRSQKTKMRCKSKSQKPERVLSSTLLLTAAASSSIRAQRDLPPIAYPQCKVLAAVGCWSATPLHKRA
ncbi:unnamed protein product, partial [Ectocarpus sp. 12 AP-2014]